MFNRSNQLITNKQVHLLPGTLLKYALFAVFALFYILAPYYVPSGSYDDTTWTNSSISNNQTDSSSKTVFSSFHFPVAGSNTVSFIKEDRTDDEIRLCWVYFSGFKYLESCLRLLYEPIQDLIQSRHPVPLFVLYHSWKSFLLS